MGCANIRFCMSFHVVEGMAKKLGFNSPMEQFFTTIILKCSHIFVFFALC
jgi:hypothetical protein